MKQIKVDNPLKIFLAGWEVGFGKSMLVTQLAYYYDSSFNLSRVCFSASEFQEAIFKAKPHQSIVYEEDYLGLPPRATMSLIKGALFSRLEEIRQKNLFIFLIIPQNLYEYLAEYKIRLDFILWNDALLNKFKGEPK